MIRILRDAWFIASRDLVYMFKQKETLLWVFLMPILFFFFIGTVTGGGGNRYAAEQRTKLAVVGPEQGGFLLDELHAALEAENYEIVPFADAEQAAPYSCRLVLPHPAEGTTTFTESVLAGHVAELRFERNGAGTRTDLDQVRVSRAIYGLLADLAVLRVNGEEVQPEALDRLQAMPRALSLDVKAAGKRQVIPSGYSQAIPGTMVMFTLLVLLTSGSILLVIERKNGLLKRLASTPVSRSSIVLGKWLGRMVLGSIQIGFAMIAGRVLFDMDWGPDLAMVLFVLVCWAAFCTSAAVLLANLVRTEQQMAGIGVISSIAMAALGGCWWPIEITPPWMQSLGASLPTGWAMDAMHQLIHFGNGPDAAMGSVALLLGGAALLGALSVRNFRYE